MLFFRVNAALGSELIYLSLRDHGRCGGEDAQDLERSILDHQFKRAAEQEVAYEHAGTVAPDDVRRLAAAPHTGSIDHVVVEQRCRVDEFDGGGKFVMRGALIFQQLERKSGVTGKSE